MTARDELIADWQHCLAAAEALAAESPRFAWLARVRIRLYRFLLACYGAGDWNQSPAPPQTLSSLIFDSADALPLCGKPAKSAGKIQAVLKAVANAQDQPLAPGPLLQGLDDTCWVVVAEESSGIDLISLAATLREMRIPVRRLASGDTHQVEVLASDRKQAIDLVDKIRRSTVCVHYQDGADVRRSWGLLLIVLAVIFGPIVGGISILIAHSIFPPKVPYDPINDLGLFFYMWALCVIAASVVASYSTIRYSVVRWFTRKRDGIHGEQF